MAIAELAWLVLIGLTGWRLGGGWWLGALVGAALLAAFLFAWGRWMAPRSTHRLPFEYRQLLLVVLGSALTVLAAIVGLLLPAGVAALVLVWAHHRHHRI